ncbi:hypothetical protein ACWEVD_03035 [Nocardia thailandica]
MGEIFDHIRRLLGVFCTYLDKVSPWGMPWPITLGCFFPVILGVLAVMVWWARGTAWRVECDYPITSTGRPCRNRVLGEWQRCHHHRPGRTTRGGREVHPLLRWETRERGRTVERADIHGRGAVRLRTGQRGLLYFRGFARPPRDVRGFVRVWSRERFQDLRLVVDQLRAAGRFDLRTILRGPAGASARSAVSDHLVQVIQATRAIIVLVAAGLVLVGVSLWRHYDPKDWPNYAATFAFLTAWAVAKWGIWDVTGEGTAQSRSADWPRRSVTTAGRWMLAFLFISVLAGKVIDWIEKLVNGPGSIPVGF